MRRRRLTGLGVAPLLAACAIAGGGEATPAHAATTVPPGQFVSIGRAPNYWAGMNVPGSTSTATAAVVDPAGGRLWEFNASFPCPTWVRLDPDTYHVVASEPCDTTNQGAGQFTNGTPAGGPLPPTATIDQADGFIVGTTSNLSINLLDEDTMRLVRSWRLPSPDPYAAYDVVAGISWYAPADQLLISRYTPTGGLTADKSPLGLVLTAIDVRASLASGNAAVAWQELVPGCSNGLKASYGTSAPAHSSFDQAIYVPCAFAGSSNVTGGVVGVVTVQTGNVDPLTHAPCVECPNGQTASLAAPGWSNDFLFDAGYDRGFMPANIGDRASAMVFDGRAGAFEGRLDLGIDQSRTSSSNGAVIGVDQRTGRVYGVDLAGLTLVDGRRTPIAPGTTYAFDAENVSSGSMAVLPPDPAFPYTRVLVPDIAPDGSMPDFIVDADTVGVTQDPPAGSVDRSTIAGPLPPGTPVARVYTGGARAFGFHADIVSGPSGAVGNAQPFTFLPPADLPAPLQGTQDLLGGDVDHITLSAGGGNARATSLGDAQGTTQSGYSQCSDAQKLNSCFQPPDAGSIACNLPMAPPCPSQPGTPVLPGGSGGAGGGPPARQSWPYPDVTCTQPAGQAPLSADQAGATVSASGAPSPVPGTQRVATDSMNAGVDCSGTKAVTTPAGTTVLGATVATAALRGWGVDPIVRIASADSRAYIVPPSVDSASGLPKLESHAEAFARGVDIDLGSAGTLQIGEIAHVADAVAAGTAGSARTRDSVVLSHVVLNGEELCADACDAIQVAAQVNQALGARAPWAVELIRPLPDAPFGTASDGSPNGSPGGYQAVVRASAPEQFGDEQFNRMHPEEAVLQPALRIVIHGYDDGAPNQSRLVLDLAGVENDAQLGLQALPSDGAGGFGGDAVATNVPTDVTTAAMLAGVSAPAQSATAGSEPAAATTPGGVIGVAMRVFHGLDWLVRSPGRAVQMAAFLLLLGLPAVAVRRRWNSR